MHIPPRDVIETDRPVGRPTEASSLVLEAWVEGYLLGALIIMACITLANMRRRVLLHKLIFLEVSLNISTTECALIWCLPATASCRVRRSDLLSRSSLGVVHLCHRPADVRLIHIAQRHLLDQEQALPRSEMEQILHLDRHPRAALLDRQRLRQLCVL